MMNTVERTSAYIHEMIEALHARDKKLILDNAKVHSAPTTTNLSLQVYFLPPYSPKMNPIELIFNGAFPVFVKPTGRIALGCPMD